MSEQKNNYENLRCFENFKLDSDNKKQETIHETIQGDKQFILNFFAKQSYYNDFMPKIKQANRGTIFYKGLIRKGLRHKSVFFQAIIKSIKQINEEKKRNNMTPKGHKNIKLYKLPKIEELKIKKKKIEENGMKKIRLVKLEQEKLNKYKERPIKKDIFPSTTINANGRRNIQMIPSSYTNKFLNKSDGYSINDINNSNSFNNNGNSNGKTITPKLNYSSSNNDISTYYKSNNTFKGMSRNDSFLNKYKSYKDNNTSNNLKIILNKCKEEINNGKEVEDIVSNYNSNFMKTIQQKLNNIKIVNRDKKVIEEKKRKNKYIKLEERIYKNIKKKLNEKISDSLAYRIRKELFEILKMNRNAKSYILHLNEVKKINEKMVKKRQIERKVINKVNSLCDKGYKKNEYLKNKMDLINKKNSDLNKLNKSINYIPHYDINNNRNNNNPFIGTLVPKLISFKDDSLKKVIIDN